MRKVADILEERVYEIAAALVLEVGKNRLEALGEAQECVDFFRVYADDFESHKGYEFELPGIGIEVRRLMLAEPLAPQPGWERIATAIAGHARDVLGVEVPVNGVPLYTDARHYAAHGIPVVLYGAGPRTLLEANAHNADENLRLSDLRAATKIVALAVADLLGR